MSVNRVTLMGNLGRDPELRYTPSGTAVCKFSVACSEKFKGKDGEQKERTEWINVVAWDTLGERCSENLAKGSKVYVEGKLRTRSWEDKEGTKRYATEVQASWVEWWHSAKPKEEGGQKGEQTPWVERGEDPLTVPDDDIPF